MWRYVYGVSLYVSYRLLFAGVAEVVVGGLPLCCAFHPRFCKKKKKKDFFFLFIYIILSCVVDVIPLHLQSCVRSDLSDWTLSLYIYIYIYRCVYVGWIERKRERERLRILSAGSRLMAARWD